MSRHQQELDPKLSAVLSRLCERRAQLTKTQAVKLPYLVEVIASHVLGRRITRAAFENWKYGVVAADVWRFLEPGVSGVFKVEEVPFSEGRVLISVTEPSSSALTEEEQEIVDFVADEFGSLDFGDLGRLTKAMNLETTSWGSNGAAKIDEDAYARLRSRWDTIFAKLERCDTEDEKNWQELTGGSIEELRKNLGV